MKKGQVRKTKAAPRKLESALARTGKSDRDDGTSESWRGGSKKRQVKPASKARKPVKRGKLVVTPVPPTLAEADEAVSTWQTDERARELQERGLPWQ